MGSTLLTLVQNACAEMGLARPSAVVGATDDQTVQQLALINAVGADLLTKRDWTALQTQTIIQVPQAIVCTANTTLGSVALSNITDSNGFAGPAANPGLYVVQGTGIVNFSRLVTATAGIPASATMDTDASATNTAGSVTISQDTYPVPADFVTFINDTQWDRGNHWKLIGPESPQEDQWLRSGIVALGPRRRFRQVGRLGYAFRMFPPPGSNDTPGPMVYEYLSSYWVQSELVGVPGSYTSTAKAEFTEDTDTCVFDDRLMIEGLKWRFFAAKGFDYSSQLSLWNTQVQISMARDGGSAVLPLNKRRYPFLLSPASVADGYFPGPGNST